MAASVSRDSKQGQQGVAGPCTILSQLLKPVQSPALAISTTRTTPHYTHYTALNALHALQSNQVHQIRFNLLQETQLSDTLEVCMTHPCSFAHSSLALQGVPRTGGSRRANGRGDTTTEKGTGSKRHYHSCKYRN